jgi:hypothetical protein
LFRGLVWWAQERDKDLGDKIEEGLGPQGLGIISIADVSRAGCRPMREKNRVRS